jgi:hypothetical protein
VSFALSPGVYTREIDLTTTIPAVATSVAVNVLRNTYKGPENEQYLVTNTDELINTFGKPTNSSYLDILACVGYLKYGKQLYCTRVMPEDATFSGTKILSGYGSGTDNMPNFTFSVAGSADDYSYTSLGTTDVSLFSEQVDTLMGADEPL